MDNIVTINNTKSQTLDFDISIQGLATDDIRVWFCIKTGQMDLNFECKKAADDGWEVEIPPLPFIEKTAYSCSVSVVADGYFFEPMVGTLNVTGSAEVYVKNKSGEKLKPSVDSDTAVLPARAAETKSADAAETKVVALADRPKAKMGERSIAQVAKDMMAKKFGSDDEGEKPKTVQPKPEPVTKPAQKVEQPKNADNPKPKKATEKKAESPVSRKTEKTPEKDDTTGKFKKDDKSASVSEMLAAMKNEKKPVAEAVAKASVAIPPMKQLSGKIRRVSGKGPEVDAIAAAILAEASKKEAEAPVAKPMVETKQPVVETPAPTPAPVAKVEESEQNKKVAAMLEEAKATPVAPKKSTIFRKKSSS